MTGPTPAPGSTPATPKEEKGKALEKFIGELPPALQAHVRMQALLARSHAAILSESAWGKKVAPEIRQKVAGYLAKHGLDVGEIDVLGGNLYRNHTFYLNRLTKLQREGLVEYAIYDHIGLDPRLDTLATQTDDPDAATWAKAERARRQRERIIHSVPDDAMAACVFRLLLKGQSREITGAKFVVRSDKDPVGNANPGVTAESRAARRCLKNAIPSLPDAEQKWMNAVDADFEVVAGELKMGIGDDERQDPDRPRLGAVKPLKQGGYEETTPVPPAGATPAPEPAPMREPGEDEEEERPF